jgi:hypothetical protein
MRQLLRNLLLQNVSVRGKIAIARYGQGFRGNKAKLAEEEGIVAVTSRIPQTLH